MSSEPFLYFDRSLGKALPDALRLLKVPNVIHQHMSPELIGLKRGRGYSGLFPEDAPDDVWLSFVGSRGWIAFSQDYSMHREPAPLEAIRQNNVKVFYLAGAQSSRWDKMRIFAKSYDLIVAEAAKFDGPFVRRVTRHGKLEEIRI